ncbi:Sugar phosphatase YfbT [Andreprevotia sp. IGB-42]|uniref:HAD-IA family hydrolase n=1 Tax=Andreprevotia sp. IGB-42 TaxID=2497473 RepID=UPI001356F6F3|nr:HAD-IA family hydrolase [Andreprevotia sp. IGB-42]KAF0814189.1 Sugar phosphatase YfbT [Andreprevotia sp. IGB-42]
MSIQRNFAAVLFDMDGTLIDSTPVIELVWRRWAERHGVDVPLLMSKIHGRRGQEVIPEVAPHLDVQEEVRQLLAEEAVTLDGTTAIAGVQAMLASLGGARWSIVTSATHALAAAKLGFVGLAIPEHVIGGDDVKNGKPHPEPYLMAAAHHGVDPADCLVFEDAISGIQSAKAAGMTVVALATSHPIEQLGDADLIIRDWHDIALKVSASGITLEVLRAHG